MAQLAHIGGLRPARRLEPVAAEPWAYRRRARLRVRFVEKKGGALVGFTERRGQRVAELCSCEVLHPSVGRDLLGLRALTRTSRPGTFCACMGMPRPWRHS